MSEESELLDIIGGYIWLFPFSGVISFFRAVHAVAKYFKTKKTDTFAPIKKTLNDVGANLDSISNLLLTDLSTPIEQIAQRTDTFENPVGGILTAIGKSNLRGTPIKNFDNVHPFIAYCFASSDLALKLIENLSVRITQDCEDKYIIDTILQISELTKTIQIVTRKIRDYSSDDRKVSKEILSERMLNEICHLEVAKRLLQTYGFARIPSRLRKTEYLQDPKVLKTLFEDYLLNYLNNNPQTSMKMLAKNLNISEKLCNIAFSSLDLPPENCPILLKNGEIWHSSVLLENLIIATSRNPDEIVKMVNYWGIDHNTASRLLVDGMMQYVSDSLVH